MALTSDVALTLLVLLMLGVLLLVVALVAAVWWRCRREARDMLGNMGNDGKAP